MDEKAIRASEREAIKTIIDLDLMVKEADTPASLIARLKQLIDTRGENS